MTRVFTFSARKCGLLLITLGYVYIGSVSSDMASADFHGLPIVGVSVPVEPLAPLAGAAYISQDGSHVVFTARSDYFFHGLFPAYEVLDRNMLTDTTVVVSRSDKSSPYGGNRESTAYGMSDDGRYVLLDSAATDLSTSGAGWYRADTFTEQLQYLGPATIKPSDYVSPLGAGPATLSSDGRVAAFVSVGGEGDSIVVSEVGEGGTRSRTLATGQASIGALALSSTGRYLAYVANPNGWVGTQEGKDTFALFEIDLATGNTHVIVGPLGPTISGHILSGPLAVSTNGRYVAYFSPDEVLHVKDAVGGPDYVASVSPDGSPRSVRTHELWASPDMAELAYRRFTEAVEGEIDLRNLSTGEVRSTPAFPTSPVTGDYGYTSCVEVVNCGYALDRIGPGVTSLASFAFTAPTIPIDTSGTATSEPPGNGGGEGARGSGGQPPSGIPIVLVPGFNSSTRTVRASDPSCNPGGEWAYLCSRLRYLGHPVYVVGASAGGARSVLDSEGDLDANAIALRSFLKGTVRKPALLVG
ncbi:MAG TPA: hypothetical protein VES97_11355, partial [Solirubrobacteraceae bacterium]|nr:hypothetical protein [Solirubrobacteraceae bacterium]